jgi:hypothetical protein
VLECGAWSKKNIKNKHDSLVVVYPHRDYYLNGSYNPEGFGFGPWHKKSQLLSRLKPKGGYRHPTRLRVSSSRLLSLQHNHRLNCLYACVSG